MSHMLLVFIHKITEMPALFQKMEATEQQGLTFEEDWQQFISVLWPFKCESLKYMKQECSIILNLNFLVFY